MSRSVTYRTAPNSLVIVDGFDELEFEICKDDLTVSISDDEINGGYKYVEIPTENKDTVKAMINFLQGVLDK